MEEAEGGTAEASSKGSGEGPNSTTEECRGTGKEDEEIVMEDRLGPEGLGQKVNKSR